MQCNNVTSVIYEDCFRTLLSYYGELVGCTEQLLMFDLLHFKPMQTGSCAVFQYTSSTSLQMLQQLTWA